MVRLERIGRRLEGRAVHDAFHGFGIGIRGAAFIVGSPEEGHPTNRVPDQTPGQDKVLSLVTGLGRVFLLAVDPS